MLCYECAKLDHEVQAVVVCRGCGAGLCLHHLHETATQLHGGLEISCNHDTWGLSEAREALLSERALAR
jgi:hypothetical protein